MEAVHRVLLAEHTGKGVIEETPVLVNDVDDPDEAICRWRT